MENRRAAVISAYALTPTSRARKDRGEEVLSTPEYFGEVFRLILKNSGLEKKDLDRQGLAVCGMVSPHSDIFSAEVAQDLGLRPRLIISSDQGGASGLDVLSQAAGAVESGIVDSVVCLGVESALSSSSGQSTGLRSAGVIRDYENPSGIMGPNSMFAFIMRRHVHQYGTKLEQIGKISVEQRKNASRNPAAYMKKEITLEDYLSSKLVSDPIKVLDCCLPVNQGLGFLVTTKEMAREITDSPIHLTDFAEEDGYYHGDVMLPDITYTGVAEASRRINLAEGIAKKEIDFAQIYDDYAVAVLMQLEDLGFCRKGNGGKFLEENSIAYDGDLPVNTGGGQLSSGQPGLAGGFVPLVEAIIQLRGEGGARQVSGAKRGLVTGIGGLAYGRNLMLTSVGVLSNEKQNR